VFNSGYTKCRPHRDIEKPMNPRFSPAGVSLSAVPYRRTDPDKIGLIVISPTAYVIESRKQRGKEF
jgi:hypothetical protein